MKLKIKIVSTALATLALGSLAVLADTTNSAAGVSATNANPNDAMTALFGDPVIAKGKGFTIKQSALDQVMVGLKGRYAAAGRQAPPDLDVASLNQLIAIQLLDQTATDADKAAGAADAEMQYTNLLAQFPTKEAFERQLKAVGVTEAELRLKASQEGTAKSALQRALGVVVTEEDAKKFYTDHPAEFEQPEQVHVRHILLMTMDPETKAPLSADQVAAKRKQIDDLLKRARAGEDFAALAKQYSEDPGSKDKGGEYTFPRNRMVPEFEAAAFSMTNGQISDVVITKYGFHIIKTLDRIPAQTVPFAKVADDVKKYLTQEKVNKLAPDYIKKLKQDADVQIVDADLKAKMAAAEAATPPASAPAGAATP